MRSRALVALCAALALMPPVLAQEQALDPTSRALIGCAPATYEVAIDCLRQHLPAAAQAQIIEKGGTDTAHFGLGMWIRNNWGLWQGGALAADLRRKGFTHPDDMSATILEGFVAHVLEQPYDLAAKAAKYRAYWQDTEKDNVTLKQACTTGKRVPVGDGRIAVCEKRNGSDFMYFEGQEEN